MSGLSHLIELASSGDVAPDLLPIVELVGRLDPSGEWSILALAAVPIARPALDLRTLLDLGRRPAAGYPASVAVLRALAENTLEISDALIVRPRVGDDCTLTPAAASVTPPPDAWLAGDADLDVLAASSAAIARFGTGPWRLWLPDAWLTPFAVAFPGSRELEPGSVSLTG